MPQAPTIRTNADTENAQRKIDALTKHGNLTDNDRAYITETQKRIAAYRQEKGTIPQPPELDEPFKINPKHQVIRDLKKHQGRLSDTIFAKSLQVSPSTWLRVKNGTYAAVNQDRVWKKLQDDLDQLNAGKEMKKTRKGEIHELSHCKSVTTALRTAMTEERNRLVVYLSPTGGGKSILAEYITLEFPTAIKLEATRSWGSTYFAAIRCVADQIGMSYLSSKCAVAEKELLTELNKYPRILVIDEAVYFSASTLDLIKAILNKTECIVLLLSLPVLWTQMTKRNKEESDQLRNRLTGIIENKSLTLKDVKLAAKSSLPNWETLGKYQADAERNLQQSANTFGLWNLVYSVLNELATYGENETLTLDQIEDTILEQETLRKRPDPKN